MESCVYFAVVIHVHTVELEEGALADCKVCGGGGNNPSHQTGPWVAGLFTSASHWSSGCYKDLTRRASLASSSSTMFLTSGQCHRLAGLIHDERLSMVCSTSSTLYIIYLLYIQYMYVRESESNEWHYSIRRSEMSIKEKGIYLVGWSYSTVCVWGERRLNRFNHYPINHYIM